ncbi:GspH/FimT family pseudopilin [bacterium]|nr:GspH/FimT family pseudopilin [bacterium]
MRSNRGLTTVELMIVLAMMGLVLASSWGNFRSILAQRRLSAATNSLATQMRLARERAVAEGNDYIVTFMTGSNAYEVWDDEGSDASAGGDDRKFVHNMPSRTSVQNPVFFGSNRVIFRPDGTCNASGAVEVTNGELTRTIAILASTGKVSIQ